MRRTLPETKELLLRTGLAELHRRGLFVAVTHVRLADVARAADLTTGAAYRVWEAQEDFHRDLAVAAVTYRNQESIDRTWRLISDAVTAGAPLAEVLRIGALAHLHINSPTDPFLISLSLRTLSAVDESLAEAGRRRHLDAMSAFENLYEAMLALYGRRMREPFDLPALSHSLAAVTEGFAIQAMTGIDHLHYELSSADGVGSEWSLVAVAVEGIVERLTEPDSDSSEAS